MGEEPVVIVGLWQEGSGAEAVTHDQPWPPTLDGEVDAEEAAKLEIFEIETYLWQGERRYAAVWREMDGQSLVERGMTFRKLHEMANREVDGVPYRLRDFECYEDHHGKLRYVGVWRPEDLRVRVERRLTYKQLTVRTAGTQDGVRLGLSEVEICPRGKGGEQFVALWVEGEEKSLLKDSDEWVEAEGWTRDDGELHRHEADWERFHHWFHNMDRSFRLADTEMAPSERRVGLWQSASGCDWLWVGNGWSELDSQPRPSEGRRDDLLEQNSCDARLGFLRLIDVEVLPGFVIVNHRLESPLSTDLDIFVPPRHEHPAHGGDGSSGPESP